MSKFDTSDKKIIETIFLNAKLEENWSGCCGQRITLQQDLHLQYKEALARKQA
jgi:hypothetical protein